MPECSRCKQVIEGKDLQDQVSFKRCRSCPSCAHPFTVDVSTKYRRVIGLLIAIISLALIFGLFYGGTDWLIPTIISYIILALFIYRSNMRVVFVPYDNDWNASKGT